MRIEKQDSNSGDFAWVTGGLVRLADQAADIIQFRFWIRRRPLPESFEDIKRLVSSSASRLQYLFNMGSCIDRSHGRGAITILGVVLEGIVPSLTPRNVRVL